MMNRQLRRAQEKKDRLKDREKLRSKSARRVKAARRRERRSAPERAGVEAGAPQARRRTPGRFASVFTVATALFIVLQALVPVPEADSFAFSFAIEVLYYLLFGYFAVTWLLRLGQARALSYGVAAGLGLAFVLQLARLGLGLPLDLPLLLAALPAVVGGAFLGRLVYRRVA